MMHCQSMLLLPCKNSQASSIVEMMRLAVGMNKSRSSTCSSTQIRAIALLDDGLTPLSESRSEG
jgi:hypothetical protein